MISGQWLVVSKSDIYLAIRTIVAASILFPVSASACQESCIRYGSGPGRGRIVDVEGRPLKHVKLLVRAAGKDSDGPETFCGARKGALVKKLKTNNRGRFDLGGLPAGNYWLTYMNEQEGESFFVEIVDELSEEELQLTVGLLSGRCYLVDIERNTTIPPGWAKPVREANR